MQNVIFENDLFRLELEPSTIPWIKLFTVQPYKELSHMPDALRNDFFEMVNFIEEKMIEVCQPDKINIASFGNYMPQVHMHIMARYKDDAYFPESMWGVKQRSGVTRTDETMRCVEVLKATLY